MMGEPRLWLFIWLQKKFPRRWWSLIVRWSKREIWEWRGKEKKIQRARRANNLSKEEIEEQQSKERARKKKHMIKIKPEMLAVWIKVKVVFCLAVILQDGSVPVKYGLLMDMEARYSSIKTSLSQMCKVPAANLTLVEVIQSQLRVRHTLRVAFTPQTLLLCTPFFGIQFPTPQEMCVLETDSVKHLSVDSAWYGE